MNSKLSRLFAAVLVLALVGGGLVWFLLRGDGSDSSRGREIGPSAVGPSAVESGQGATLVDSGSGVVSPPDANAASRRDVVEASNASVATSNVPTVEWTGLVRWPAGTPDDEQGTVRILTSLGERAPFWDPSADELEPEVISIVPVGADGRFVVDVPVEGSAWIDLEARYGYLDRPLAMPARGAATLELRPQLGAWVVGEAAPPTGLVPPRGMVALTRAGGGMNFRRMMDAFSREHDGELDGEGKFEIGGVPAGNYSLRLESDSASPLELDDLTLRAGIRLDLDLALEAGVRLAGRVVDQDGAGVSDVRVRARKAGSNSGRGFGPPGMGRGDDVTTRTDEEGRFMLSGLTPGSLEIEASGAPLLEDAELEVETIAGQMLDALSLIGTRGVSLRGRVTWSDGTPAMGATILPRINEDSYDGDRRDLWRAMRRAGSLETEAGTDGSFELDGADPELTYDLIATLDMREVDSSVTTGAAKFLGRGELAAVNAADSPVAITLEPETWLAGFVQDPAGDPVAEYVLTAEMEGTNPFAARFGGNEPIEETVQNERGEFTLAGLEDGTWRIAIEAVGFAAPPEPFLVEWPSALEGAPPVFTVVPEARVSVRVVGPDGSVVPGAEVRDVSTGWQEQMRGEGRELSERTDALGEIELTGLSAGRYLLSANATGFAPSEPLEFMLEPGDYRSDVQLQLLLGGRIEGTLLDENGEIEGRSITLTGSEGMMSDNGMFAQTDAKGRFELEAVPAGSWSLIAMPVGGFGRGGAAGFAGLESVTAEVLEGETTFVELGTPPAEPVTVTGLVTFGGEPAEADVTFVMSGENLLAGLNGAESGSDGRYTITLDEPGTYMASAQIGGRRGLAYRQTIVVASDATLDIAIPSGGIAGRIREDGEPKRGVSVRLMPEGPLPAGAMLGTQFESVSTDSDGNYQMQGLDAGTYRVSIGSARFGFGGNTTAMQVVSNVDVQADEITGGVDFELETPGKIVAKVVDSTGKPVGEGALFVRDSEGRVVNPISISSRSTDGTFDVENVAPGRYTISFRSDDLVSSESSSIGVTAGETSELELTATAGTELVVTVVDGDGEALDARIEVLDSDGKEFQGMQAMDFSFGPPAGGWSPGKATYGPLAPGSYTVRALHSDGRESRRKVKLTGQPERKLTVRLR